MSFIWPPMLATLVLVPVGILLYRWIGARQRRRASALAGRRLAEATAGRPPRTGRTRFLSSIPAVLFVGAFVVLAVAAARPQAAVSLPRSEGTVILAFDVSASMAADDLKPTRMEAAKAAAKAFVEHQPAGVVIGIVAFSDAGLSVQVPTSDEAALLAAIDRLAPARGTSLGQGILASLAAVAKAESDTPANYYSNRTPDPMPVPTPVPPGSHGSALVVLLSDGENNESPDPIIAAQAAADQGIRIDTVGIGSAAGTTLTIDGFQMHTQLDAATLQQVAQITDGSYYDATDSAALLDTYQRLETHLVLKSEQIEVTALLAGAAIALFAIGGLISFARSGRLP
jgi:Ca-activated chloride channel family protein